MQTSARASPASGGAGSPAAASASPSQSERCRAAGRATSVPPPVDVDEPLRVPVAERPPLELADGREGVVHALAEDLAGDRASGEALRRLAERRREPHDAAPLALLRGERSRVLLDRRRERR